MDSEFRRPKVLRPRVGGPSKVVRHKRDTGVSPGRGGTGTPKDRRGRRVGDVIGRGYGKAS